MADDLRAYLDLSPEEARAQWRRILQREQRDQQERFLPVEVLLCFGLFWKLNPHQFGGGNIDRVPAEAKALAATLQRSPGSLTSKMLNLDGSRRNGAREEPELFLRLAREPDRFAALYSVILASARQVGLDDRAVPDFLGGLVSSPSLELLGQEELGPREVDTVLVERASEIEGIGAAFGFQEVETTRLVEQRVRLGQHRFAGAVLASYDHRCGFCGFAPRQLSGHRLLVASHIKPWAAATDRERLDPSNGVCACPVHDSAFDTGLLTVGSDLRIRRAAALASQLGSDRTFDRFFGEDALNARLLVPPSAPGPSRRFLEFHERRIFRG
jgi:putative restriction endonuclease